MYYTQSHMVMAASPTYSEEQAAYIQFEGDEDTKLLATAGSGKTFCIIHHIIHLTEIGAVTPDEVYMLTFSKNAKDDFRTKVRKGNFDAKIRLKNICTIDSFAYCMLGHSVASTIDVSLLSYAWMDELENNDPETLLIKYPRLSKIKMVFVDEAQDLNEVQYRILIRMKHVCTTPKQTMTIHMVGDPNQNIYQFRNSSDKYLINFPARTFYLTRNYRSQSHIVEFSSYLRPYNNVSISAETPKSSTLDVTFYAYDSSTTFEHLLMSTLHMFQARNIPLHKCAILAPTRGYIRNPLGMCKYKGLCYIANLLYHHNIPFKQFYSDTNANDPDAFEAARVKYKPTPKHLNLMTYTASKGLEWDYVIIIDANAHLITRVNYDQAKYMAEKYLLYVACSRPRKNLLVFTKSHYANPWFKDVPSNTYKISPRCQDMFKVFDCNDLFKQSTSKRQSNEVEETPSPSLPLHSPAAIINQLTVDELYMFDKRLRGRHMLAAISPFDKSTKEVCIPEARAPFMRYYLTHLYYVFALKSHLPFDHHFIVDVRNILDSENILVCTNERIISWYYENRSSMNWDSFDIAKPSLDPRITTFVTTRFDREKPFNVYTLVDKFYELYIQSAIEYIRVLFDKYINLPPDPKIILHVSRVAYAIRTTHYFYIRQAHEFEDIIYNNNEEVCKDLMNIADVHHDTSFIKQLRCYVSDNNNSLYFSYDKTHDDRNLNIRTRNTLSIKDILGGLVTQHIVNPELPFTEFYTLQLSPPALFKYTITVTQSEREDIFNSLLKIARKKSDHGTDTHVYGSRQKDSKRGIF